MGPPKKGFYSRRQNCSLPDSLMNTPEDHRVWRKKAVASKAELQAEVQRIMAEVGGYHPVKGKPYPRMDGERTIPKKV